MKGININMINRVGAALAMIGLLSVFAWLGHAGRSSNVRENTIGTREPLREAPVYPQLMLNKTEENRQNAIKKQNRKLRELSRQISALEQQIKASPETHDKVEASGAEEGDSMENDDLGFYENQTVLLENTVESEPVDGEWAGMAESEIEERVYSVKDSTVSISDLDCRSTLCRVDLVFDPSVHEQTFNRISDFMPWGSEIFFKIEDVMNGEAVVYVARKDFSLPRFTY